MKNNIKTRKKKEMLYLLKRNKVLKRLFILVRK
jgi:hypothetical protein